MSPTGSDEDEKGLVDLRVPNGNTDNEDGEIHIKRLPPDVIPVQATEHMMEEAPPYMNGNLSEGESPVETDSSEDMNMAPHMIPPPPPLSKYTNREDMVRVDVTTTQLRTAVVFLLFPLILAKSILLLRFCSFFFVLTKNQNLNEVESAFFSTALPSSLLYFSKFSSVFFVDLLYYYDQIFTP